MSDRVYLLDTTVLLALVRGGPGGVAIDEAFGLRRAPSRALISVVTVGEMRLLAARNAWGEAKLAALERSIAGVVVVDINHPVVIASYVELALVSERQPGGARVMGKNDLWIAACARAAGAYLLTTDRDFEHLVPSHVDGEVLASSA